MRLEDIRAFITLAKLKHFAKAADQLCVTQPAISRRIQVVETYVDRKLFDRSTRDVKLTPEGESLLREWEEPYQRIIRGADMVRGQPQGELQLGICSYSMSTAYASLTSSIHASYPELDFNPVMHDNAKLVELLLNKKIQFAFIEKSHLHDELDSVSVSTLEYRLVMPDEHPLIAKNRLQLDSLDGERIYAGDQSTWGRQWRQLYTLIEGKALNLNIRHLSASNLDIMRRALLENAVALIPESDEFIPLKDMTIRAIDDLDIRLNIVLAWRAESANPLVTAVTAILSSVNYSTVIQE